jgi:hypothetical protein
MRASSLRSKGARESDYARKQNQKDYSKLSKSVKH